MTDEKKPYRQGDILFLPVAAIPRGLQRVPLENGRVVVAHGEATGHTHAVVGPEVEFLAADLEDIAQRFLRIESEAAEVRHEEHGTITLPPGDYEVRRQREYAPEAPVYVAD
jgi:hypothetical protein